MNRADPEAEGESNCEEAREVVDRAPFEHSRESGRATAWPIMQRRMQAAMTAQSY
jgi:hypothetical protein